MVTNTIIYCLFHVFCKFFQLKQHHTILLHRSIMADFENIEEKMKIRSRQKVQKIVPKPLKIRNKNDDSNNRYQNTNKNNKNNNTNDNSNSDINNDNNDKQNENEKKEFAIPVSV